MIIMLQGSILKGPFTDESKITHHDVEKWETIFITDLDPRSIYKITFAILLYEGIEFFSIYEKDQRAFLKWL